MFLKNLIRCYIIRTINSSADFLKTVSLIERDKFHLAKKIKENPIRSADYSFLEKLVSIPYYIYKFPYKIKFLLKKSADLLESNKNELNFFFSTIQAACIIMIPIAIFLSLVLMINYWNYLDEFLVKNKLK